MSKQVVSKLNLVQPPKLVWGQLKVIISWILNFLIYSPVMKILTGLEFLLKKADKWEAMSPKKYSVQVHIDELLSVVSRWRRQELEYWPNLLRAKEEQFEANARQWWFRLYALLHLGDERVDLLDLHKLLVEFIETSNFGEFSTRMELYCYRHFTGR